MNRKWEAHTNLRDGFSRIVFEDGEELTVKNDGVTGFAFVEEYLEEMRKTIRHTWRRATSSCACVWGVLIRQFARSSEDTWLNWP